MPEPRNVRPAALLTLEEARANDGGPETPPLRGEPDFPHLAGRFRNRFGAVRPLRSLTGRGNLPKPNCFLRLKIRSMKISWILRTSRHSLTNCLGSAIIPLM